MYKYLFSCLLVLFPHTSFAKDYENKYFEALKLYADRDLVLNDTLEFSLFDMSELKFINDSKPIKVRTTAPQVTDDKSEEFVSALDKSKTVMEELPKFFYRSLRQSIVSAKVPVTLYASESPSYAKPLQLYIKVKHIHLKPYISQPDGSILQPVSVRIYGQLKDKQSGETLIKYYDTADQTFVLLSDGAKIAYTDISAKLMQNLALFLKTKY